MNKPVVPSLSLVIVDGTRLNVDPVLAGLILTETHYAGQRPVNEQHALLLGMEMEQGTFLPDTQLAFGRRDGDLYLLNGRHRMHAVELSGRAMRFSIVVYEVNSDAELGGLYCRFDTMVRKRSSAQIIAATGLADEDSTGLGRPVAQLLYSATPLLMIAFERIHHGLRAVEVRNVDRRVQFAKAWKPAALLYQKCLDGSRGRLPSRFRSVGVAAAAFATLRYQPELGEVFWAYAIANDALHIGDPRRTLYLDLVERRAKPGTEYDLARLAATAWNAFFEKRPLKLIKVLDGPIRIAGTPFGKGRAS
jgi:hypothetical protein